RGRATQSSAAPVRPSHCTNSETRPRSGQNGASERRTSANTTARSSEIRTTANTIRGWQKSGRKLSTSCRTVAVGIAGAGPSAAPGLDIGRGLGSDLVDLGVVQVFALAVRQLPVEPMGSVVVLHPGARDRAVALALLGELALDALRFAFVECGQLRF